MMGMLDGAAVSYHLVLTKADKVKPGARRTLRSDDGRRGQASCRTSGDLHDFERNR